LFGKSRHLQFEIVKHRNMRTRYRRFNFVARDRCENCTNFRNDRLTNSQMHKCKCCASTTTTTVRQEQKKKDPYIDQYILQHRSLKLSQKTENRETVSKSLLVFMDNFPDTFLYHRRFMRPSCSRSKDTRYTAMPDMRICARVRGGIAIGLFHYKSFAADKALYPKKLPRRITWILYWLSPARCGTSRTELSFPRRLIGILYDELD